MVQAAEGEKVFNKKVSGTKRSKGPGSAGASTIVKKQRTHGEVVYAGNVSIFGESIKSLPKDQQESRVASTLATLTKNSIDILPQLAVKHDSSRVLQLCLKYCSEETRNLIMQGLKGHFGTLASNVYGYRVVIKLLSYHGNKSEVRDLVVDDLRRYSAGGWKALAVGKDSSRVVDFVWRRVSTERQRRIILKSFYGKEFELFANLSAHEETEGVSLEDILKKHPEKTSNVLHNISNVLSRLSEKHLVDTGICHRLLLEYLSHGSFDQIRNMISEFTEHSKQLLQTKDGIRAVCKMMQYGTVKDRKVIAKAFKGHVAEMVSDNEGYLALLTALSVNDDIRLIQDFVFNGMQDLYSKIAQGGNSRKLILQLLSPNNSAYLSQAEMEVTKLVSGYTAGNDEVIQCSKKDPESRSIELLATILPNLFKCFFSRDPKTSKLTLVTLLESKVAGDVLVEFVRALTNAEKSKRICDRLKGDTNFLKNLLDGMYEVFTLSDEDLLELLSHQVGHMSVKKALQLIGESQKNEETLNFLQNVGDRILSMEDNMLSKLMCTRGTWVIAKLVELSASAELKSKIHKAIKIVEDDEKVSNTPGFKALVHLI